MPAKLNIPKRNSHRTDNTFRSDGMGKSPEFWVWVNMKRRCLDSKWHNYHNYGGRGIKICPEWTNSFHAFYVYIGPRPSLKHSIDRIDNDGNYEPGNVRWATRSEQNNNRRNVARLEHNGEALTLSEWAARLSVPVERLRWRLHQEWDTGDILFGPPRR